MLGLGEKTASFHLKFNDQGSLWNFSEQPLRTT